MPHPLALSYVLPLRHDHPEGVDELSAYVGTLAAQVAEVLVVDGSPAPVFDAHADALAGTRALHVRPDRRFAFANGKVAGVLTGLERASHEAVVVADEDVRWDRAALAAAVLRLAGADVVRPQNYFDPLPWHARWDTARSLLNRAFGADYPGTLVVRRSTLVAAGGYNGDVLFENLELMRTVRAVRGTVVSAPDLYVRRLPPTVRGFVNQRVRQAYDDFAQPLRLVVSLAALPGAAVALARRRPGPVVAVLLAGVLAAERGRHRDGGARVFPPSCVAFTPLWMAERAVCTWLAVGSRLVWGGIRYRGRVLRMAATPTRELRRRLAA
jgi:hypothetical protein